MELLLLLFRCAEAVNDRCAEASRSVAFSRRVSKGAALLEIHLLFRRVESNAGIAKSQESSLQPARIDSTRSAQAVTLI